MDLNAFLEHNARTLSSLHAALGNAGKATHYKMRANKLLKAIEAVSKYTHFWNVQRRAEKRIFSISSKIVIEKLQ